MGHAEGVRLASVNMTFENECIPPNIISNKYAMIPTIRPHDPSQEIHLNMNIKYRYNLENYKNNVENLIYHDNAYSGLIVIRF